jgi:hypothetical protein
MSVALLIPIELNGTEAVVTDPCYYNGSEYMIHSVKNIQLGGEWKMGVFRDNIPGWGERTVELTVVHSTFQESHQKNLAHAAGVDSGQMSICGSIDADRFENPDNYGPRGFEPAEHAGLFDYQGACDLTLNSKDRAGVLCNVMAVSGTGCGDGVYPVYVWRDTEGMATKISVLFNEDDEDEENDEEVENEDEC